MQQLLEERELAQQSLAKYKVDTSIVSRVDLYSIINHLQSMLDSKRIKGTIKLGGNSAAGTIMTHKQGEKALFVDLQC